MSRPRRSSAAPIALIEEGDTVVVDVATDRLDCRELDDPAVYARRADAWKQATDANGGVHPHAPRVTGRVLARMRATAQPALRGGGMTT